MNSTSLVWTLRVMVIEHDYAKIEMLSWQHPGVSRSLLWRNELSIFVLCKMSLSYHYYYQYKHRL